MSNMEGVQKINFIINTSWATEMFSARIRHNVKNYKTIFFPIFPEHSVFFQITINLQKQPFTGSLKQFIKATGKHLLLSPFLVKL